MTTHQDNAIRLARIAQILAVVVVVVAVAAFLVPIPAKGVNTNTRNRSDQGTNPDGSLIGKERFEVRLEDWLTALEPLNANHSPTSSQASANQDPKGLPGVLDPNDPNNPDLDENPRLSQRPPIRYLGHIDDSKGFAALIDYAGRQFLLRVAQEFEDEFEITKITKDEITVTDGFDEFTFEIAQSNLANVLPSKLPLNPNGIPPGGRPLPGQQDPLDGRTKPRKPGDKNDDGGSPA